ncbi:hypothetical protein K402DRAFT_395291 [Aulographum hederae CBS 113979]|uniref:Uncharacterized protein n=1 Tax=Aulographum hederae CBS 113979 TaxID=1176131 RepID=A0A6G1GVD6_9PEZI|nr:hypothetical protein K402DRAFT_395291 [Aulographum hederae CBS 113979]
MRFGSALLFTSQAAAAAINFPQKRDLSDVGVIQAVLENPHLVPRSSYNALKRAIDPLVQQKDAAPKAGSDGPAAPAAPASEAAAPNPAQDILNGMGLLGGVITAVTAGKPTTDIPTRQMEKAVVFPQAERVKLRYGPYRLPSTDETNIQTVISNSSGMIDTYQLGVEKPCEDCMLLGLVAGMEYADGKTANTDTGSWLHHTVLVNSGPEVLEPNCGKAPIEDIFMSGNERSYYGFAQANNSMKVGYPLRKDDRLLLVNELMSMDKEAKWVWLTLSFEYMPKIEPDYKATKLLWMTVGPSCTGSENPFGPSNLTDTGAPKEQVFAENSVPWTSIYDGTVLNAGGHMHDGGINVEIFQNEKMICDSVGKYGMGGDGGMKKKSRRDEGPHGGGHGGEGGGMDGMEHVQEMSSCMPNSPMKKGDKLHLKVNYDLKKHPGMTNPDGSDEPVMGIASVVLATDL